MSEVSRRAFRVIILSGPSRQQVTIELSPVDGIYPGEIRRTRRVSEAVTDLAALGFPKRLIEMLLDRCRQGEDCVIDDVFISNQSLATFRHIGQR
jgi:hypothetical protein